jgi:hypothetical protein
MDKIDLGTKYPEPSAVMDKPDKGPKVSYPTIYASKSGGENEGFDSLPKGDFHFHGKGKVLSRGSKEDDKGKFHHTMEMEIHHVHPMDEGESGDAGDGLASELSKISKKKASKNEPMGEDTK